MKSNYTGSIRGSITRRTVMAYGAIVAANLFAAPSWAANDIGRAVAVRGEVTRKRFGLRDSLAIGEDIRDKDVVETGPNGYTELQLINDTAVFLGRETEFVVNSYVAAQGGTLELGTGTMVFDRPANLPKIDVSLRTAFGMIGVRGTKYFCGMNRGVFAVFVEHGRVSVTAGGETQVVSPGEGVEITRPGAPPSNFSVWGENRIREAYGSVGLVR